MLDTVVRKLVEWRYERALRQFYLGNSVKVGERQLPGSLGLARGVCRILDMDTYDLYVSSGVRGGAQAVGSGKPMIVVDSQLLQSLGPGEQRVVLAHELGHILSDHVMYMTALNILLSVDQPAPVLPRDPVPRASARCCSSGTGRRSSAATGPPRSRSAIPGSSAAR